MQWTIFVNIRTQKARILHFKNLHHERYPRSASDLVGGGPQIAAQSEHGCILDQVIPTTTYCLAALKFALSLSHSVRPTSQKSIDQLIPCPTYMAVQDRQAISTQVYNLAASSEPIGERVKEALDVIENALDTYACVLF